MSFKTAIPKFILSESLQLGDYCNLDKCVPVCTFNFLYSLVQLFPIYTFRTHSVEYCIVIYVSLSCLWERVYTITPKSYFRLSPHMGNILYNNFKNSINFRTNRPRYSVFVPFLNNFQTTSQPILYGKSPNHQANVTDYDIAQMYSSISSAVVNFQILKRKIHPSNPSNSNVSEIYSWFSATSSLIRRPSWK